MFSMYNNRGAISKTAFELSINPASIIGAVVGTMAARETAKRGAAEEIKRALSPNPIPVTPTYYKEVDNFANNVVIHFTPLGVIYSIKNGPSELTVDQIGLDEMTPEVRTHFDGRDAQFFKNLMFNKMRADIDLTETILARRLLERKLELGMGSTSDSMTDHFGQIKQASELSPTSEALDYILDEEPIFIYAHIEDKASFFKYASILGEVMDWPMFIDKEKMLSDPEKVMDHLSILFLPDRVIFVADKKVIAQISRLDMNEEGNAAFLRNDVKYFRRFLADKLGVTLNPVLEFIKTASDNSPEQLFFEPMVHPELLYNLLTKHFDVAWLDFDPEVLVKAVEENFTGGQPIDPLVLNKLMTIQAANSPKALLYKNAFIFEKVVRAFNGDPIDFTTDEDNISLGELVFALRVLENVTPVDDIYDNLSPAVIDYMEDVLSGQHYLLIDIVPKSEDEKDLFDYLDVEVRTSVFDYKYGRADEATRKREEMRLGLVVKGAKEILTTLRTMGTHEMMDTQIAEHIQRVTPAIAIFGDQYMNEYAAMVRRCVEQNAAVDVYLDQLNKMLGGRS